MPSDKTLAKPSKTRPYQSSIPRPKPRFNPPSFRSKASTDDSDLENRYERYSRDKRKLTVANAEVLPSGSSSESEVESGRGWDTGVGLNNRSAVGLGNVADIVFGISYALDIDGLGLAVDGSGESLRSSLRNPFYAEVLERRCVTLLSSI